MIHVVMPVGLLKCNCSIFGDELSKQAFVIDPGDNIDKILAILEKHQLTVKAVVITHGHIDHIAGANKLRAATGAPVYMNGRDNPLLDAMDIQAGWLNMPTPERPQVDSDAADGALLRLSETGFHIMHTPGHTPGSLCLWIPSESKLIAGDTLFRDSIGRTDLPGGDSRQILSSIQTRLMHLPEETTVIPGHGPSTTIGREKERNPFLRNL